MRLRSLVLVVFIVATVSSSALAKSDPTPYSNGCDTWYRHDTEAGPNKGYPGDEYNKSGPSDINPEQSRTVAVIPVPGNPTPVVVPGVDTPENLYIELLGWNGSNGREGVRGRDFYIQAIGGNSFGSGQDDDPLHRGAEGGVVQGEIHVEDATLPNNLGSQVPNIDFAVSSFGPSDEYDTAHTYDTAAGACVSVTNTPATPAEKVGTGVLCPVWTTQSQTTGFHCDAASGEMYLPTSATLP
ncbi:MAG: hypothetical protein ABR552_00220 [Actinomycetota bacterium]|nr:hypothetical protein [Actinomycetota bacterium]